MVASRFRRGIGGDGARRPLAFGERGDQPAAAPEICQQVMPVIRDEDIMRRQLTMRHGWNPLVQIGECAADFFEQLCQHYFRELRRMLVYLIGEGAVRKIGEDEETGMVPATSKCSGFSKLRCSNGTTVTASRWKVSRSCGANPCSTA